LTSGEVAGAGLDVLVDPAPPVDHRLLKLDNVLVTPHVAFYSPEAVLELEERSAREVVRVLRGEMPENLVNPAVIGRSRAALG
jgi:D-3-phosphoglycerate dehydrogenase